MPSDPQSLVLEANASCLCQAMAFVRNGALEASLPEVRVGELDLMVEEIFLNVCVHAYPESSSGAVTLTYWITARAELKVEVADQGIEFNPLIATPPDITADLEHRPIGGLGVLLVKKLASSLTYRREDGWNRLTFGISPDS